MGILETLLKPEYTSAYMPNQLTKKQMKKKKNVFQIVSDHLVYFIMYTVKTSEDWGKILDMIRLINSTFSFAFSLLP